MTDLVLTTGKLSKKERDALPEEHFAVPGKRKMPIHDEHHTKLAWDMVDRTKDLSPGEKKTARERILHRAKELGIDTKDWNKVRAMRFQCMSLNISNSDDHPNKMPFAGVLTKLDEPSDEPPGGANGKRIIVTTAAARAALSSLLGMAVDYTPSFDGHDTQAKIGIITSANIVGNEVQIEGFVYAADYPDIADLIRKLKDVLGFSFEAQRLSVADMSADVLEITELTFTGAAILMKDKAAYQTTSLAASAEEDFDMTAEELKAILDAAIKPITDRLATVEAANATLVTEISANANVRASVEPHCAALESSASAMEAAGVGASPQNGHAAVLRRMASGMRAEAAIGKVPHIFRDHDYPYYASADKDPAKDPVKQVADQIQAAVEAAVKPLQEKLAAAETKITDAANTNRLQAAAPERKTLSPAITNLLIRAGIEAPGDDKKLALSAVDNALKASGLDTQKRIMVKNELDRAGMLSVPGQAA